MKGKVANTSIDSNLERKYAKAQERVSAIKGFYNHVITYIVINVVLLFLRPQALEWAGWQNRGSNVEFIQWIDLNILLTPVIWGIILFIHYVIVFGFKPPFLKKWEQAKIQQLLESDMD